MLYLIVSGTASDTIASLSWHDHLEIANVAMASPKCDPQAEHLNVCDGQAAVAIWSWTTAGPNVAQTLHKPVGLVPLTRLGHARHNYWQCALLLPWSQSDRTVEASTKSVRYFLSIYLSIYLSKNIPWTQWCTEGNSPGVNPWDSLCWDIYTLEMKIRLAAFTVAEKIDL